MRLFSNKTQTWALSPATLAPALGNPVFAVALKGVACQSQPCKFPDTWLSHVEFTVLAKKRGSPLIFQEAQVFFFFF